MIDQYWYHCVLRGLISLERLVIEGENPVCNLTHDGVSYDVTVLSMSRVVRDCSPNPVVDPIES